MIPLQNCSKFVFKKTEKFSNNTKTIDNKKPSRFLSFPLMLSLQIFNFYVYPCFVFMHGRAATCVPGAHGGQREVSGPLELKFEVCVAI